MDRRARFGDVPLQVNVGVVAPQYGSGPRPDCPCILPLITVPILPPLPTLPPLGIAATRLGTGHEAAVTTFCRQCSEFFALVAGDSPAAETARIVLGSRPPNVEPAQKHVVGFERGGEIVAIVDLVEGFPGEAEWYVGLLLLAPAERTRGLGTAVWNAMEVWIRAAGGRRVRLIVQQQNPAAARFWHSVGFTANGEVEQVLATRTNLCWRFEKQLAVTSPRVQPRRHSNERGAAPEQGADMDAG